MRFLRSTRVACFCLVPVAVACTIVVRAQPAGAGDQAGPAFGSPATISSRHGVLRARLVARAGDVKVGGRTVRGAITYNGGLPGPTLAARPGDRLELKVVNKLTEPTNIHFHGLHVSPRSHADNVFRLMPPGSTTRVSVRIPRNHPNGLFWYHPHHHKLVNQQVYRGLAGLVSIEGGEQRIPGIARYRQRLMALQNIEVDERGDLVAPGDASAARSLATVNGKPAPKLRMRPGATELWRVANASNEGFYKLSLSGHRFTVIAEDGSTKRRPQQRRSLLLPPGKRFEFLVRAGKAGQYTFRREQFFTGRTSWPEAQLGTLTVAGPKAKRVPPPPKRLMAFADLASAEPDIHRRLRFTSHGTPRLEFLINSRVFDPARVNVKSRVGNIEEWTIVNQTGEDHPFHLHTNRFQVVAIGGRRVIPSGEQDVVNVPRNESVTIRFKVRKYNGKSVYHCHILFHEDHGMMGVVDFVRGATKRYRLAPPPADAQDTANPAAGRHANLAGGLLCDLRSRRLPLPDRPPGRIFRRQ